MAGHPFWKTRSEYPDRLGISRGYIHCRSAYYFCLPRQIVLRQHFLTRCVDAVRHLRASHHRTLHLTRRNNIECPLSYLTLIDK
jgi:hypothetical protein